MICRSVLPIKYNLSSIHFLFKSLINFNNLDLKIQSFKQIIEIEPNPKRFNLSFEECQESNFFHSSKYIVINFIFDDNIFDSYQTKDCEKVKSQYKEFKDFHSSCINNNQNNNKIKGSQLNYFTQSKEPRENNNDITKKISQSHPNEPNQNNINKIFKSTRNPNENGFNEAKMHENFSLCEQAVALEKKVARMGYQYLGTTLNAAKASTHHEERAIRINQNITLEEATLSYAYELSNASKEELFKNGPFKLWNSTSKNKEDAENYAKQTIRLEANSILIRSQIAIQLNYAHLIKNSKYNEIATNDTFSQQEKEEEIYNEMIKNGTVQQGKKKVLDHYIEQFMNRKLG